MNEGEPAILSIETDPDIPVKVQWFKMDEKITQTDRITQETENNSVHKLIFKETELDDESFYKCILSNDAGEISCDVELLVDGMSCKLID